MKKLKDGSHREVKIRIPTFEQAWDEFISMKKNQISPNTLKSYTTFINKWVLSKNLANTPIDKVTTKVLQSIVNEILESGKSPRTS